MSSMADLFTEGAPEEFLDPHTKKLMVDPVFTPSGLTYDRSTLDILERDPRTQEPFIAERIQANEDLRKKVDAYLDKQVADYVKGMKKAKGQELMDKIVQLALVAPGSTGPYKTAQTAVADVMKASAKKLKGASIDKGTDFFDAVSKFDPQYGSLTTILIISNFPSAVGSNVQIDANFISSLKIEDMAKDADSCAQAGDLALAAVGEPFNTNIFNYFENFENVIAPLRAQKSALKKKLDPALGMVVATLEVWSADDKLSVLRALSDEDMSLLLTLMQQYADNLTNVRNLYELICEDTRAMKLLSKHVEKDLPKHLTSAYAANELAGVGLASVLCQLSILKASKFPGGDPKFYKELTSGLIRVIPYAQDNYGDLVNEALVLLKKYPDEDNSARFIEFLDELCIFGNLPASMDVVGVVSSIIANNPSVRALNVLREVFVHYDEGAAPPSVGDVQSLKLEKLMKGSDSDVAKAAEDLAAMILFRFGDISIETITSDEEIGGKVYGKQMKTLDARIRLGQQQQRFSSLSPKEQTDALLMALKFGLEVEAAALMESFSSDDQKTNEALMESEDLIAPMVNRIKKAPLSKQAIVLDMVKTLARSDNNAALIAREGGIHAIISIMQANPQNADLNTAAAGALNNLSFDPTNAALIAREGGVLSLLEAMDAHPNNAKLQEMACGALWNLSYDENNKSLIKGLGGIHAILKAIRNCAGSDGVAQMACGALGNLAYRNDHNISLIGREGGVKDIVGALKKHASKRGLCEAACGALNNLSVSEDNSAMIAREGGIETIISTMARYVDSVELLESACGALWNLALKEDNTRLIANGGGVKTVLEAMKQHPDSVDLLSSGCCIVSNLALNNDDYTVAIGRAGGVKLVLELMQRHAKNANFLKAGCGALNNLSLNPENKGEIVRLGGVRVILATANEHMKDARLLRLAVGSLISISFRSRPNKEIIGREGGVKTIIAIMAAHLNNADLQETCCGALNNLSFTDENRSMIAREGGLQAVFEAMNAHPNELRLLKSACDTIGNFAYKSDDHKVLIGKKGGIKTILNVIKNHQAKEAIVESAVSTLWSLSSSQTNVGITMELNGPPTIMDCMRIHRENDEVYRICKNCLKQLGVSKKVRHQVSRSRLRKEARGEKSTEADVSESDTEDFKAGPLKKSTSIFFDIGEKIKGFGRSFRGKESRSRD